MLVSLIVIIVSLTGAGVTVLLAVILAGVVELVAVLLAGVVELEWLTVLVTGAEEFLAVSST